MRGSANFRGERSRWLIENAIELKKRGTTNWVELHEIYTQKFGDTVTIDEIRHHVNGKMYRARKRVNTASLGISKKPGKTQPNEQFQKEMASLREDMIEALAQMNVWYFSSKVSRPM